MSVSDVIARLVCDSYDFSHVLMIKHVLMLLLTMINNRFI